MQFIWRYLVVWAPKDYIMHTVQYFYRVLRVKVNSAEVHAIEFSMNHFFFMTQESKAQKQRPVGLNNHINEGIISDTAHSMILKDVKVSQSPKYESQERRLYFVKPDEGWSFSTNLEMVNCELGPTFEAEFNICEK